MIIAEKTTFKIHILHKKYGYIRCKKIIHSFLLFKLSIYIASNFCNILATNIKKNAELS